MPEASDNKRQQGDATRLRPSGASPHLGTRLLAVAIWLLVWQLASMVVGSSILLSGPLETLQRLLQLLTQPRFLSTVWFSSQRIVGGFLVAYVSAVVLAMAAHRWPVVGVLLRPAILTLKSVPIACVIVLLLIWVGSRQVSGPAVFLAVFPAVYFSCAEGLTQVDEHVDEMLRVFGVGRVVRLCAHVWPQVLPYLVGTGKNVCGMAWKAGIAAELIGSPLGSMGERIYQSKIMLETADLFAWTIVVVLLSALCEQLFIWLLRRSGDVAKALALAAARVKTNRGEQVHVPAPAAISLSRATIGYGDAPVVEDLTLELAPASRNVLVDASGAGKTTLLRTVAGLQAELAGQVERPSSVSVVFQEARLLEHMSAVQNVMLVCGGHLSEGFVRDRLLDLLPSDALDVAVSELSGGQRRRVEIVRALLHPSEAVLLDEPFSSLDERTHRAAAAFVSRFLADRTLLVASHAPDDVELLDAQAVRLFERLAA